MVACSSKTNTLFYVKANSSEKTPVRILLSGSLADIKTLNQKILPGDLLAIRNLQNETQVLGYNNNAGQSTSTDYLVESDSTVALPFLNKVKLGGLYLSDAEFFLNRKYSENLLKDPIIKLKITNLKVTMMGEFGRVGNISLNPNKSFLTDIIAEAGGINVRGNPKNIKIIRGDFKNPTVIAVNLQDISALAADQLFLQNNDIIYAETKSLYKFLDQLSSTRSILAIGTTAITAYILIDRLSR